MPALDPEVVFPSQDAPNPPHQAQILPSFPAVAGFVDRLARRIPWWAWVGLTLAGVWWAGRRKGRRRIVEEG